MTYKGIPEGRKLQVKSTKNRIKHCNVTHLNSVHAHCINLNVSWSICSSVIFESISKYNVYVDVMIFIGKVSLSFYIAKLDKIFESAAFKKEDLGCNVS